MIYLLLVWHYSYHCCLIALIKALYEIKLRWKATCDITESLLISLYFYQIRGIFFLFEDIFIYPDLLKLPICNERNSEACIANYRFCETILLYRNACRQVVVSFLINWGWDIYLP